MERSFLEDLWFSYIMEKHVERAEEERLLAKEMEKYEMPLRDTLNKEQKQMLEKVLDYMGEIHTVYENKAFAHGIRFGVKFLLEALRDE